MKKPMRAKRSAKAKMPARKPPFMGTESPQEEMAEGTPAQAMRMGMKKGGAVRGYGAAQRGKGKAC